MAQIPGVPSLQPVELPYFNPREMGKSGAAIAELGEVSEGIADQGIELEGHIRAQQGIVDRMAAGNQLAALWTDYQADLKKTTDSRTIDEVKQQWQSKLNDLAKAWSKSPDAVQIGLMADRYRPEIEQLGTAKQVDLMGKEWDADWVIQQQSLLPQYVQAVRNGDTKQAKQILDHINDTWNEAIQHSLKTPDQKQIGVNAFQIAARKDLNEAAIASPNPIERAAAIAQLKNGGGGPLDLTNMAPGETNVLLDHAQEIDKKLKDRAEAQDLNANLNKMYSLFTAPEFKNSDGSPNFDGERSALEDKDWLTKHGFIAEDGSPNRIMAEKLITQVESDREAHQRQQKEVDEKGIDKWVAQIDDPKSKVTDLQLDDLTKSEHLSSQAVNRLKSYHHQLQARAREQWHFDKAQDLAGQQAAKQQLKENSAALAARISGEMDAGTIYEPSDIRLMAGLTDADKNALISIIKSPEGEPTLQSGLLRIKNLQLPDQQTYELKTLWMDNVKRNNLQGGAALKALEPLEKEAKERHSTDLIDSQFNAMVSGQRARNVLEMFRTPPRPKGVPSNAVYTTDPKTGKKGWAW